MKYASTPLAMLKSTVLDFYITTRFREFPSFQVRVSTFHSTTHITCSGLGNQSTKQYCSDVISYMLHFIRERSA